MPLISAVNFAPRAISSAAFKSSSGAGFPPIWQMLALALMSRKNLAGFPIRLLVIRFFANLDADAGVAVAFVRPAHRVFLHHESVRGGLALDDLGNFLLRHFLFLRFWLLRFSLSVCVYSRTITEIARPYVRIQSP